MSAGRHAVLGLAALAWGALPATLQGAKCTPRDTPDAETLPDVIVIVEDTVLRDADGAPVVAADSLEAFGIETHHIRHVDIICWRQVEAEYDVRVRSGAISIQLVEGAPRPRRKPPGR